MSDTRLYVRVYPEEKALIRRRAARHGLSISEYVRRQVASAERRELLPRICPLKNVRTFEEP
jgi:uncharacterized protein (DUF1778 family)